MEMQKRRRKVSATAASKFYCYEYFCSSHILITFVGMTLLIVNYGVNTVQMSAVPYRNEDSKNISGISRSSISSTINSSSSSTSALPSSMSGNNLDIEKNTIRHIRNAERYLVNVRLNSKSPVPVIPTPAYDKSDTIAESFTRKFKTSAKSKINHTVSDLLLKHFRSPRFLGLLGSNFSLSYNLSITTGGTSAGNITVIAPAATPSYYYYAPAPSYPYYYPNNYGYDPYAYNPYAYNPYAYNPYGAYNPYSGYTYG